MIDQDVTSLQATKKTAGEILELLSAFRKSGLSIKAFCQAKGIPTASFHYWRKKHQTKDVKGGFSTLELDTTATLFAEVGSFKLYQPVSAAYLKELLS